MPTALPSPTRTPSLQGIRTLLAGLLRLAAALPSAWTHLNERHRQRQALADLDDRLLRDLGITRRQAERECGKPPWQ